MKEVSIIGTVGVPACYGGFESLVENMLDYKPEDVDYTVFCSEKNYEEKLSEYKNAKLKYLSLSANGIQSIPYDIKSMWLSRRADVLLILGVSGCLFLPILRLFTKAKIITNIDGLEWRRDKWNKLARWLLKTSEKQAVKYSDIVIGDNKGITDYIMKEYPKYIAKKKEKNPNIENPVLIAYGADHAQKVEDDSLKEKYAFMKAPYAVTVCRIEPENNIQKILEAFSKQEKMPIVMVGNWDKSDFGKEMKEMYGTFPSIILLDPIYESHEINCIRSNASLYIHGHSAGGTNPSLVEAMNLGLPVFAFDCVYNRATTFDKSFYWDNSENLQMLVETVSELQKQRCAQDLKHLAEKFYTWKLIADKYNSLY